MLYCCLGWIQAYFGKACKKKRVYHSAFSKLLHYLKDTCSTVEVELSGLDMESSYSQPKKRDLFSNPVFRRMVAMLNEDMTSVECWTRGGDIMENRDGLFWGYIWRGDPTMMTRAQLVQRYKGWEQSKKDYAVMMDAHSALLVQERQLDVGIQSRRDYCQADQNVSAKFAQQLEVATRECEELYSELDRLHAERGVE